MMILIALLIFYISAGVLASNYKKVSLTKNQVRSASVRFLSENKNYIIAAIAYTVMTSSLGWLAKMSYEGNNFDAALIVSLFIVILVISKGFFLSPYGLRSR